MRRAASQTKRIIRARPQDAREMTTAPMTSTPPIVGVPCFAAVQFGEPMTSAAVRIGWPTLSEINLRMT